MSAPLGSIAASAFDSARRRIADYEPVPLRRRVAFDLAAAGGGLAPGASGSGRVPEVAGSLADAARALRTGESSCVALLDAAVAAAESQHLPDALADRDVEGARRVAAKLDAELAAGHDRGPLHGIPVTVKDVIDVAGLVTACGSDAYLDHPTEDATAVARWRGAGAVVFAKAVTHEFALGVTCPQLRNPHDPTRIPGGSSGGSAVALVEGIGLASLGTDTRASIRTPAALSGTVGLKPTYGRVPTEGVVSLSWTMDHVAPMATTVGDAAIALDALLGGGDLAAAAAGPVDLAGVRIGVPAAAFAGAEAGVGAAVHAALDVLRASGCVVAEVGHPDAADLDDANAAGLIVSRCEAATLHRRLGLDRARYWQEVREQLDQAEGVPALDYLDAQRLRAELRDRFAGVLGTVDLLAMPTSPVIAPRADRFAEYLMLLSRNAIPWSFVGFPAISLPVGRSEGLPVGLQLVALPHAEPWLVAVAAELERRLG